MLDPTDAGGWCAAVERVPSAYPADGKWGGRTIGRRTKEENNNKRAHSRHPTLQSFWRQCPRSPARLDIRHTCRWTRRCKSQTLCSWRGCAEGAGGMERGTDQQSQKKEDNFRKACTTVCVYPSCGGEAAASDRARGAHRTPALPVCRTSTVILDQQVPGKDGVSQVVAERLEP